MRKKIMITAASAAAVMIYVNLDDSRLQEVHYNIISEKVTSDIRIAQISDLHSHLFGEKQKELTDSLSANSPDIVVLTGDIFDDRLCPQRVFDLVDYIKHRWQCFYVTGNHECESISCRKIKSFFRDEDITVLEGTSADIIVKGSPFRISGLDDPDIDEAAGRPVFEKQWRDIDTPSEVYSILLSHRPELADMYASSHFDLVLSGHAHGGQWRIPGILNGLFAPDEGLFPRYAGGSYKLSDKTSMIVSRGLQKGNKIMPRICNRPELVYIDIQYMDAD